jgi:4-hydroxybenzoate polyprenyltransferase
MASALVRGLQRPTTLAARLTLVGRPRCVLAAVRPLCTSPPPFTDINEESLARRALPAWAWPYAALGRWDRPIGTWLLLWPCFWSTALAAPAGAPPDASLLALFGVGAFAMRGAGCTINDLWDRDIDRQVERTRNRPLASGALGVGEAVGFLGAQLSAGLAVLLALPPYAVGLGFCSVPLFSLYPLAKRFTAYPQAVLGLTFNWGALMGLAATHGALMAWPVALPLYAGGVWWTLLYDTIYAHQVPTISYERAAFPGVLPAGRTPQRARLAVS